MKSPLGYYEVLRTYMPASGGRAIYGAFSHTFLIHPTTNNLQIKMSLFMCELCLFLSAEEEATCDLKIMPEQVFPFTFPIFSDEDDPLVRSFHK